MIRFFHNKGCSAWKARAAAAAIEEAVANRAQRRSAVVRRPAFCCGLSSSAVTASGSGLGLFCPTFPHSLENNSVEDVRKKGLDARGKVACSQAVLRLGNNRKTSCVLVRARGAGFCSPRSGGCFAMAGPPHRTPPHVRSYVRGLYARAASSDRPVVRARKGQLAARGVLTLHRVPSLF